MRNLKCNAIQKAGKWHHTARISTHRVTSYISRSGENCDFLYLERKALGVIHTNDRLMWI